MEDINNLELTLKIAEKTIGYDIAPMKFEDIGQTIQNIVERVSKGMFTTNKANGITEQLIATTKNETL